MEKKEIIEKYRLSENDTGSVQVQIALLTARINHLNEHLKKNHKDNHSRRVFFKWLVREKVSCFILKRKISMLTEHLSKNLV